MVCLPRKPAARCPEREHTIPLNPIAMRVATAPALSAHVGLLLTPAPHPSAGGQVDFARFCRRDLLELLYGRSRRV